MLSFGVFAVILQTWQWLHNAGWIVKLGSAGYWLQLRFINKGHLQIPNFQNTVLVNTPEGTCQYLEFTVFFKEKY